MNNRNVLISGASIAGSALAFWLHRHGFNPTLVERAPAPRLGGHAIDVRGVALEVARRMGLLQQLRDVRTRMRGMSFVDAEGRTLMSTTEETLTGGPTKGADVELLRDDLVRILHGAASGGAELLFDDSITALAEDGDGVLVTFERRPPRRFDLVVGADGLHSRVRSLAFGPEERFIRHLGSHLAIFSAENLLGLDHWQVFHRTPDALVGIYSARENTEARVMLGCASPPVPPDPRDVAAQKRFVAERFGGMGWVVPRLLEAMWAAPDFYFDSMSQILMDRWSSGRTVLVGDAGYCGSPMSGQGTSLALVGAYVLARELAHAGGEHTLAFGRYEQALRGFAEANQRLALEAQEGPPPPERIAQAANALTLEDAA